MALMDRFREAWEDLRFNNRKEEQEATSVTQSVADSPTQWGKDYKAAVTPGESIEPVPLDRGLAGNAVTLALDSEPARLKRVGNMLDHGSTENAPSEERSHTQDPYLAAKQEVQPALQSVADEHYRGRLDLVGEKHETRIAGEVAERTGLPVETVRMAASDVLLDAYVEQREASRERLDPAVGEAHSSEFRLRENRGEVWTFDHKPTGEQIHLDAKGRFHDLEEGNAPRTISREEVIDRFQKAPESILTETPDHRQRWDAIEKAVGYHGADQLQYYAQRGDVGVYRQTVEEQDRFIGVDGKGRFYQVDQESFKPEVRIGRDEAMEQLRGSPNFYTPAEPTPNHKDWSRLEQAVGRENAVDFTFRGESAGVQSYQHDHTGNHVRLDSDGQFHNAEQQPIAREAALVHALPPHALESSQAVAVPLEPVRAEGLAREQSISL